MAQADMTVTVKLDTSELDSQLAAMRDKLNSPPNTSPAGLAVAGLIMAGSTRAKMSRRSLLGLGWLASGMD